MNFFFFNDTATTEIYTLSLHDALPIFVDEGVHPQEACERVVTWVGKRRPVSAGLLALDAAGRAGAAFRGGSLAIRSEEHTSELQSRQYLVCRLLLEKKKKQFAHYFSIR